MKIKIPKAETEGTFEGWVRVDTKNAVAVYRKMLARQRKANSEEYKYMRRMRGSMLLYLSAEERSSTWVTLPLGKIEKVMAKHDKEIKYRNCTMTPFFYMRTDRWCISVWPRHHQDDTRNKDNNWGEEE